MAQVLWNTDIDVYNEKVIPVSVARCISWYLDVPDLLHFSCLSKNAYRAVKDPALWISKLAKMGVWDSAQPVPPEGTAPCNFDSFDNPLSCLSVIYKSPKLAKFQLLRIRHCLLPYYKDLQSNTPYNHLKIFKNFHTPQDQARLLSNLLKYNAIDADDTSRTFVRQKITDLMEIFENALLRELEIHYDIQDYEGTSKFVQILLDLNNDQTIIDFFLQKTCFDNDTIKFLNPELFVIEEFYRQTEQDANHLGENGNTNQTNDQLGRNDIADTNEEDRPNPITVINESRVDEFMDELSAVFNDLARIIDLIFPQSVAMMYKISEELITNQLQEVILMLTTSAKEKGVYLEMVPMLYKKLTQMFLSKLNPCMNVGENYCTLVRQLIDVSYDSYVLEFLNEEKLAFRDFCRERIRHWKKTVEDREAETTQSILKHVRVEAKNDFLSNFRKVFAINTNSHVADTSTGEGDPVNYSEVEANAIILAENLKSLNKVFSPELAFEILKGAKSSLEKIYSFHEYSINSVLIEVHATMQDEFMDALESLGTEHLKIGFEKALRHLKEYDPNEISIDDPSANGSAIGPLVIFFESIHTADMIVQMLDIFYKEEMIQKNIVKNENSVLNPSLQSKRKLEGNVDKYVADGLNIGIEVLFKEIESVFLSMLKDSDYNPPASKIADGPTPAARRVVSILEDNIDLLVGSAEKAIIEVFQQEVAERFFQAIVKSLKRSTISVDGAVTLISDLNLYYDFILKHIQGNKRMIYPLFQALKKVGTIYLIGGEDAKAIGQLVSDLSKFNGIFSQEEIYEFVQRRQDWPSIKKHVEKVMYGLGLIDCCIS